MADIANKYAENVSGKFYVDDQPLAGRALASGGQTWSMDAAHFQQSLDLLVATGWREPAGETTKTRRYRLSASARGHRRFEDLVARVKGSAN